MHTRQANITDTLEQVLSVLQELKDNGRTTLQNQGRTDNSSSSQPQISNWEDVSSRPTVKSTNRPPQEFTSNVSSIRGAMGAIQTHSAYHTDQENQVHAHDEAFQIDASYSPEHQVRNYASADRGTGYRQYYSDNSGMYSYPYDMTEYPRTNSKTSRCNKQV